MGLANGEARTGTATVFKRGPTVRSMMAHSLRMTFMVMVITYGVINVNTKVSGNEIRCMELAFSLGVMVELTKEGMSTTKSMVMAFSGGLMGGCTMVSGSLESNMVLERTLLLQGVKKRLVSGKMDVDYVGSLEFG